MDDELSWQWKAFVALGKRYEATKAALEKIAQGCDGCCDVVAKEALRAQEAKPDDDA